MHPEILVFEYAYGVVKLHKAFFKSLFIYLILETLNNSESSAATLYYFNLIFMQLKTKESIMIVLTAVLVLRVISLLTWLVG